MDEASIFLEALQKSAPADRAAYLDEACAGDAELLRSVEMLLKAHAKAGDFLNKNPADVGPTLVQLVAERPGTVIGPYKLLQQIGEGGMGVVWMAEQTQPVQRKVALKVIKPGMDSQQVIARFEAERQALAMMDHVNIARVLDAGATESSLPYFVMELVHGVPITKYCDDNHLSPRERLELFVPVCQAIQHAHQKGIIHRDIKPSNVMITLYDGKPVPKIIDFGVAKATEQKLTERTLFTQYGTMVGTLEYMSPEQAEMSALGVDTRSDIYSLGVLLYELLTGSTPLSHKRLKEAAYGEVLRMIKEEEPPKPSTRLSDSGEALASISAQRHMEPAKLTKLVRGELDWIVMKCLEKDRNRRYETANGFAADVQRYLNDEQVQACPPSAGYRFRKFARRNRAALTMVSVVVLAALLLVGSVGWMVRDRAVREETNARDQAARQANLEEEVIRALGEAENFYKRDRLPEALADLKRAEGLLASSGGSAELQQRVRQWRTDLEMVGRLDDIRLHSASVVKDGRFDMGSGDLAYQQAFRQYGLDLDLLGSDAAAELIKTSAIRDALLAAVDDWVFCREFAQGRRSTDGLLAVARRADADPWRTRLRSAFQARDKKALLELAGGPKGLAQPSAIILLGRALLAVRETTLAADVLRQAQSRHSGNFWINQNLAHYYFLMEPAQAREAVGFYRAALALRPECPGVHLNLGNALRVENHWSEAEAEYREAIRLKPDYAEAYNNLGNALRVKGRLDEASAAWEKAIALDPKYPMAHTNLGNALAAKGRLEEAIAAHEQAIALGPKYAPAQCNLGVALRAKGRLEEAIAAFEKAIALDSKYAPAHSNLGYALRSQGRLEEAIACFRKAIELQPDHAQTYSNLGIALHEQGQRVEAIACYRKAIELQPDLAPTHYELGNALEGKGPRDEAIVSYGKAIELQPDHAATHYNLGNALKEQGQRDEAIACYRKAIQLKPEHALAHYGLGNALKEKNQVDEAITCFRKAIQLKPDFAPAHNNLGNVLRSQGRRDEAIACFRKAIQLQPDLAPAHYNLGNALMAKGELEEAVTCYREAARLKPEFAQARNNIPRSLNALGWRLVAGPNPTASDAKQAIALATEAIELAPKEGSNWTTLGLAHYRAQHWKEAIADLEKSRELFAGKEDGFSAFVLAMANWRLDKKDEARQWYDRIVQSIEKHQPNNEELRRFRAEAAELLGIKDKK